jgi:hypothetical protein
VTGPLFDGLPAGPRTFGELVAEAERLEAAAEARTDWWPEAATTIARQAGALRAEAAATLQTHNPRGAT